MRYSTHFRDQAVLRVVESGRSLRDVAEELQVHPDTLRRWVRAELDPGLTPAAAAAAAGDLADPPHVSTATRAGIGQSAVAVTAIERASVGGPQYHLYAAPNPRRQPTSAAIAYLAVAALWGLSISLSALLKPSAEVQQLAAAVHILALVVSFGAVVVVDWHGLLWLFGRRDLRECTRVATTANPLIWAGLAGLLASGALLRPDLGQLLVWAKLVAVLLVLLNGVSVSALAGDLETMSTRATIGGPMAVHLRRRLLASNALSGLAWWAAIIIGFVTESRRR